MKTTPKPSATKNKRDELVFEPELSPLPLVVVAALLEDVVGDGAISTKLRIEDRGIADVHVKKIHLLEQRNGMKYQVRLDISDIPSGAVGEK